VVTVILIIAYHRNVAVKYIAIFLFYAFTDSSKKNFHHQILLSGTWVLVKHGLETKLNQCDPFFKC
jgi:hypothetical protein